MALFASPGACRVAQGQRNLMPAVQRSAPMAADDPFGWEALLTRANAGDGRAFAHFLTAISPTLRSIIRARGASLPPDQHEDILQEVLLAIHLKRQTWQPGTPVRPWLYAITRYKIVDAFRRRGSRLHLPIEDFADILPQEPADPPLAARDADVMLTQIDTRSAALLRAVVLDGDSTETAGARLGLTTGAARTALHRARKRLAELATRMTR